MNQETELILDTHIWIWWVDQNDRLAFLLLDRISFAGRVAISTVSIYELIQANSRGRLDLSLDVSEWLRLATEESDIELVPVDAHISQLAAELPSAHGDPLDRMIIATALATSRYLISLDRRFAAYPSLSGLLIAR